MTDDTRRRKPYHYDRRSPEYRFQFAKITEELPAECPVAWSEPYGGHWVASSTD